VRLTWHVCKEGRFQLLTDHLGRYGIRHFDSDDYWEWGGKQLGKSLAGKLDRYRAPIVEGTATKAQEKRFYDLIAAPKIAGVVHSQKADAIRASGEAVASRVEGRSRILDLGCGIGYLTTYYARLDTRRVVTGWDISKKAVRVAQNFAARLGVENVQFDVKDFQTDSTSRDFDVVASSQVLSHLEDVSAALGRMRDLLVQDGILACVEGIGRAEEAIRFVEAAKKSGLVLNSFDFCRFSDLGMAGAYPVFVFSKSGESCDENIASLYAEEIKRLSG